MKKRKQKKGFSLIEVLIALAILTIGLLGLAGMTAVVLRNAVYSRQSAESTSIASNLLDMLKLQNLTDLPDCNGANRLSTIAATCTILLESGVAGQNNFFPSVNNSTCGLPQVLNANAVARTFDRVGSDFLERANFGDADTVCAHSSDNLSPNEYIRYFVTFLPAGAANNNVRTISVVVLWRDREGRWRSVRLSTTRSF